MSRAPILNIDSRIVCVFGDDARVSTWLVGIAVLAALSGCNRPTPVVLLTVDTLRPDHLSTYGYSRPTDAATASLARDGVVFTRAFTTTPKTTPAYASMFTGLYPHHHGLIRLGDELAENNLCVAEILAEQGYDTAGFVSSTVMIDRLSGLGQGFALWDDEMPSREHNRANFERKAASTVERVLGWLGDDKRSPLFLFVHLIDPHGPYLAPMPYAGYFRGADTTALPVADIPSFQRLSDARTLGDYIAAYDGEIAYTDTQLGRILDALRGAGLYQRSLIIVTADHGESFGEDGGYFRHGKTLEAVSTHIPLIIKPPGGRRSGVSRLWPGAVSLVDIVPTITDYVEMDRSAPAVDGVSLRPIIEGRSADRQRVVFSQRVGVGGVQRGAHGGSASVMMFPCRPVRAQPSDRCRRLAVVNGRFGVEAESVAIADGSLAPEAQPLTEALASFDRDAKAYTLPFPVRRRYHPGDKSFVEGFVSRHNQNWRRYRSGDVEALRALGYLQ